MRDGKLQIIYVWKIIVLHSEKLPQLGPPPPHPLGLASRILAVLQHELNEICEEEFFLQRIKTSVRWEYKWLCSVKPKCAGIMKSDNLIYLESG
jgi:hypothetical protein